MAEICLRKALDNALINSRKWEIFREPIKALSRAVHGQFRQVGKQPLDFSQVQTRYQHLHIPFLYINTHLKIKSKKVLGLNLLQILK